MLHDSDAPQVILKTTLIVAATELPSDLHPLMAALVGTINAFIDKGLKRNSDQKKPGRGRVFWVRLRSAELLLLAVLAQSSNLGGHHSQF